MKKRDCKGASPILGRIVSPILDRPALHKSLERNQRKVPAQPYNISADRESKELSIHFPEGADINLRLEFGCLGREAIRAIEKEFMALSAPQHPRKK
jgi:hypothetical protein